jgi:MOSC domain-containing protein YiiM
MLKGEVVAVYIAGKATEPPVAVNEVQAMPNKGLAGDRYFDDAGTFSNLGRGGRDVTLIEEEALEGLQREYGIALDAAASRRNILTRGVSLNDLVGREFRIGEVRLCGARLCEPCEHLNGLIGQNVLRGLVHRAGLRADVLTEGTIRVGDTLEEQ